MKKRVRKFINTGLSRFGYTMINSMALKRLQSDKVYADDLKFILKYPIENASNYLKNKALSKSQINQDLFVLSELNFKKNGFFVEFGATDGISFSNSFLLEKEFKWKGILAEPGKCWHDQLIRNREVFIEKDCLWSETGKVLTFNEVEKSSLSTIDGFGKDDNHRNSRTIGEKYDVKTISLVDLLEKYNAPKTIDYLSIDTEGSELIILESFDFSKFAFRTITVEHNYSVLREKLFDLLTSKGYTRVHKEFSLFDDWYVLKN
jgi:FkbM family methyltransferase